MMGEKWFAYASEGSVGKVVAAIRQVSPGALVVPESSPQVLRRRVLGEVVGRSSVAVGESEVGISPVNLAAGIVADGHAREVMLVCSDASGSLRSRAARAGITRVMELVDIAPAAPPAPVIAPAASSHPAEPSLDLDEPDYLLGEEGQPPWVPEPDGVAEGQRPTVVPPPRDLVAAPPATGCPVLCLASGRGGVGKTATAAVMASAAVTWGMRVALVDYDLASGNLFSYFGLAKPADLARASDLPELHASDIGGLGVQLSERLGLWGPCERPEMAETLAWRAGRLVELLSQEYDLVIVDTSTTFTDAVAQAVQMCDRLLLVADERQGAVGSLTRAASLAVRLGVPRTRIVRVMNRCDPKGRDDALLYRGQSGLETARTVRLLEGEGEVGELLAAGHVSDLASIDNDFTESVTRGLASELSELGSLPECPAAQKAAKSGGHRRHGLFSRIREAS